MNVPMTILLFAMHVLLMFLPSCSSSKPNELDKLGTVDMTVKSSRLRLWIADDFSEQLSGLMFVTAEQMADLSDGTRRGMIFIFRRDQQNSFWMKNTIIPLDIAYVQADGTVDSLHTMAPLDTRSGQYPPLKPYRFAIEVNAGTWSKLDLKRGDRLDIPESILNRTP